VPCTLPGVLRDLRPGERVCFDDGKIEGHVVEVVPGAARVEVAQARAGGESLRADKGINLPDSQLSCTGLTDADRIDLDFVARHADLVGLSFVRSPEDVLELQRELALRSTRASGILVKIETRQAFEALPRILLAGMRARPLGVMVARGDLAVEVGFERLAEVQEEILWLCEAAHVPVVWATQVLDGLTRKGRPSRAEVTDAAMSVRAECVMLNKGPHAAEAVRFLDDVLLRMQQHHSKKRSLLRRLSVSDLGRVSRPALQTRGS
jgi:pyruvate kinase